MQPEHIRMSDHSPSVGEERMVFVQPNPLEFIPPSAAWCQSHDLPIVSTEDKLAELERRIVALESRTWWSMLKEWISACRLRFIGR